MTSNAGGVRIRLDLSAIDNCAKIPFRMTYLSYNDFTTVKDLKKYIKNTICGSPVRLFLGEQYWLPSSESIRILQNDDLVLVKSRSEDVPIVKTDPVGQKRRRSQLEEDDVHVSKVAKKSSTFTAPADKTSPNASKLKTKDSVETKKAKVVEKSGNKVPESGKGKKIIKDGKVKSSSSESESSSSDEESESDSKKMKNGAQKTKIVAPTKPHSNSLALKVTSSEKKVSVAITKAEEESSSSDSSDEEEKEATKASKSSTTTADSKVLHLTSSNPDEKKFKKRKRKRQPKNKNKLPMKETIIMPLVQQEQKTEPVPKVAEAKKEFKAAPLPSQETLWSSQSYGRNGKTFRHIKSNLC